MHSFGSEQVIQSLASGHNANGLLLFAASVPLNSQADVADLYRSTDGGITWGRVSRIAP